MAMDYRLQTNTTMPGPAPSLPQQQGGPPQMNPYIMGASAAAQGVGALADIYGTYKGVQMAEKQYEQALKQYEEQKRRAEEQDRLAKQQMQLGNIVGLGQYAQGVKQNTLDTYGSYNQQIGR